MTSDPVAEVNQAISAEAADPSAGVTPQAAGAQNPVIGREEKIEYRDENGNLLDEAQVAALEGKVSFSTRYETRTRVVDADGNEIAENADGRIPEGVAPPHPDAEGRNPETPQAKGEAEANEQPPTADVKQDVLKEKSVNIEDKNKPRPASEAKEATK